MPLIILVMFFAGCAGGNESMDVVMTLRNRLETMEACEFLAMITADYSEKVYTFTMQCRVDKSGTMYFEVLAPDTISHICGNVSGEGGKLTFDDKVLGFELLVDDIISPVSAPWLVIRTLRAGYVKGCSKSKEGVYTQFADSYMDKNLSMYMWFDGRGEPSAAELVYGGKRFLSVSVTNFVIV